jgi:bifunctional isochorismate lyase / aryl carrier protein
MGRGHHHDWHQAGLTAGTPSMNVLAMSEHATPAAVLRSRSTNALKKNQITPYAVPSKDCLLLNKVDWPLQADDAVLLVHDMQQFWLDFFIEPHPLLSSVQKLIVHARKAQLPIVYTRGERPKHAAERALGLQMWGPGLAHPDVTEQDIAITTNIAPQPQDFVIDKVRVSAFYETPLQALLQKLGRRQLWICGVFAHHGVMVSCIEAFMRNYKVQLIADAIGDYSEDDHWMALRYVAQTCGRIECLDNALHALHNA